MAVVELRGINGPAVRPRRGQNALADVGDAAREGRHVGVGGVRPMHPRGAVGHALQDLIGQVVHQTDQEMTAAHRRIADFQLQDGGGGIVVLQFAQPLRLGRTQPAQRLHLSLKSLRALVEQGADRLPDEQLNQIVVGVITAAALAGENGGADPDLASAVADHPVFQQALVDRAQLLHRQIAVIDPAALLPHRTARQAVNQLGHHRIGQGQTFQQGMGAVVEQAAVVGRHAERSVALADDLEQVLERAVAAPGAGAEDSVRVQMPRDLLADDAQGIVVIARVVDR